MQPALVFVYGTLKRGYRNNRILETAEFVSEGTTVARCRLFHAGFPVLRRRDKPNVPVNAPVRGEVYEVTDAETMDRLDRLECEGRIYHRRRKKIRLTDGRVVLAWTYVGDTKFWRSQRVRPYDPQGGLHSWPGRLSPQEGLQDQY